MLDEWGTTQADTSAWKSKVSGWQEQFPMTYEPSEPGQALKPQFCIEQLRDLRRTGEEPSWPPVSASIRCSPRSTGRFDEPYTWVNSGGLGTMGFSIPAAIGAKAARPRPHGLGDRR